MIGIDVDYNSNDFGSQDITVVASLLLLLPPFFLEGFRFHLSKEQNKAAKPKTEKRQYHHV